MKIGRIGRSTTVIKITFNERKQEQGRVHAPRAGALLQENHFILKCIIAV